MDAVGSAVTDLAPACRELALLQADSGDAASLQKLARSARVIITTVGPYVRYGEALVRACAAFKCAVVLSDPLEQGRRAILNLAANARDGYARLLAGALPPASRHLGTKPRLRPLRRTAPRQLERRRHLHFRQQGPAGIHRPQQRVRLVEQLHGDAAGNHRLQLARLFRQPAAAQVADEVVVETRKAGSDKGYRWRSDGQGEYSIEEVEGLGRGTVVMVGAATLGDPPPLPRPVPPGPVGPAELSGKRGNRPPACPGRRPRRIPALRWRK